MKKQENVDDMNTVIDLLNFQLQYLNQLVENISEEQLYEKQMEGFNSAGWILGHICVEADDVIRQLDIHYQKEFEQLDDSWEKWFKNSTGKIESFDNLPKKKILVDTLRKRYVRLGKIYTELNEDKLGSDHPSKLLRNVLTSFDSWFAHHLTTHIAMHCGNIVVWKKIIGIPVNGF